MAELTKVGDDGQGQGRFFAAIGAAVTRVLEVGRSKIDGVKSGPYNAPLLQVPTCCLCQKWPEG